jgi:hypothetical protein
MRCLPPVAAPILNVFVQVAVRERKKLAKPPL